tara:strand:+ start:577 stop:792 length:216 start_codon:yes stop_codon:yes gene_type:complete
VLHRLKWPYHGDKAIRSAFIQIFINLQKTELRNRKAAAHFIESGQNIFLCSAQKLLDKSCCTAYITVRQTD